MDNVGIGPDTPAEDEVGLSLLGVRSPYLDIAFPNRSFVYQDYLDLESVSPAERETWKRQVMRFWQSLTYRTPRRLLLKSPTHTARIKVLLEMFPTASFVYIVRNPYDVFPSMRKTLSAMWKLGSLQSAPFPGLDEFIYSGYLRVIGRIEEDRRLIEPSRFCEIRYEDLTRDPIATVRAVYERLSLGSFERVQPRLQSYLAGLKDYQSNRHELPSDVKAEITKRWGRYIESYGYAAPELVG
jgi:hypothetical protein